MVSPAALVGAIACIKQDTALGPDDLRPSDLRLAPPAGIDDLLELFQRMEGGILVPEVFKQALAALLGKPPLSGERHIALLHMLHRVWMHMHNNLVSEWDAHWY